MDSNAQRGRLKEKLIPDDEGADQQHKTFMNQEVRDIVRTLVFLGLTIHGAVVSTTHAQGCPVKLYSTWSYTSTGLNCAMTLLSLVFLISRMLEKTAKGEKSPLENKLHIPFLLLSLAILGVSIWGLVLTHSKTSKDPGSCEKTFDNIHGSSVFVVVVVCVGTFFRVKDKMFGEKGANEDGAPV